jgi:hypothetical protein
MSTLTITETKMTSDTTRHRAAVQHGAIVSGGPTAWEVTWLPGRLLTRNQAITAMTLAEMLTERAHVLADPAAKLWWHVDAWASELGLSRASAVAMASVPPEDVEPVDGP